MFWAGLGVMLPTLASGIAFSILSKNSNDTANDLYNQIALLPPHLQNQDMILRQNDWVDKGEEQKNAAIAFYVVSGVGAVASIVSIFVFRKEKPAAQGTFEVSGVAPIADPATHAYGLGLSGTF
jgi:hypothetical protein